MVGAFYERVLVRTFTVGSRRTGPMPLLGRTAMTMTTTSPARRTAVSATPDELIPGFRGDIWTPDGEGWDLARSAWNLAADQRPTMVAVPVDAGDVIAVVQFARRHSLRVAPQGTGHNATALAGLEGAILVATRRMRGVVVDPRRRRVRVAAGTLWSEVTEATTPYGLFPLAGSSPNVGVVGYSLGGGLSWLGRLHGLAANHVVAIEVVTPDGVLVRATATDHSDLFWALRGGGGNLGVVTALEMSVFDHGEVYAGMFLWPYERHADVLSAWRDWTRTAPETATTSLRIMHLPPLDELPPFLAGRSVVVIDGAVVGDTAHGTATLDRLRELQPELDTWASSTPAALSHIHMDPEPPTPARSGSMLVDCLDDTALVSFAGAVTRTSGLLFGEIRHLGGALGRSSRGGGVLDTLRGEYLLFAGAIVPTHEVRDSIDGSLAALHPVDAARLYDADAYSRLRGICAVVDPDGVMLANHPVPVAVDSDAKDLPSS
jgi:hypothetical protein